MESIIAGIVGLWCLSIIGWLVCSAGFIVTWATGKNLDPIGWNFFWGVSVAALAIIILIPIALILKGIIGVSENE